jgi:hypothetical protein
MKITVTKIKYDKTGWLCKYFLYSKGETAEEDEEGWIKQSYLF